MVIIYDKDDYRCDMNPFSFSLAGKTALVTGGNGGIGLGMAKGLAANGANVVIWGTNLEKNTAAAKELANSVPPSWRSSVTLATRLKCGPVLKPW